jgi:hypothetical protein
MPYRHGKLFQIDIVLFVNLLFTRSSLDHHRPDGILEPREKLFDHHTLIHFDTQCHRHLSTGRQNIGHERRAMALIFSKNSAGPFFSNERKAIAPSSCTGSIGALILLRSRKLSKKLRESRKQSNDIFLLPFIGAHLYAEMKLVFRSAIKLFRETRSGNIARHSVIDERGRFRVSRLGVSQGDFFEHKF